MNQFSLREDRQQCNDVGETFMKGGLVGARGVHVPLAKRVDESVRGFMNHDVVGEARVYVLAATSLEIPEDEAFFARAIEGIGVQHSVRGDFQLMCPKGPTHSTPQREFKAGESLHDQGIGILGMKAKIVHDPSVAILPGWGLFGDGYGQFV